jgi:hypothetical protein
VDAVAAVATSELEAALGELNLSEDADAQMNEDTNDLLPDLDENDEDGPGFSYMHLPRNGHEVIPFPSYTTRQTGNPAQPLLDAAAPGNSTA